MEPNKPDSQRRKITRSHTPVRLLVAIGFVVSLAAVFAVALISVRLRAEQPGTDWANWNAANPEPENLDFKRGTAGWFQPPISHASATVDPQSGPRGEPCLVLTPTSNGSERWSEPAAINWSQVLLGQAHPPERPAKRR